MSSTARRRKGEGTTYYDEARDLWVGEVVLGVNERGKRRRKRVTSRSHDEMLRKLRALQVKVDQGLPLDDRKMTVREWCEHYMREIAPYGKAAKSSASNEQIFRDYVIPYVGSKRLAQLGPHDVRRMMRALEARPCRYKRGGEVVMLSPATVARARAQLSAALTAAVRDEILARNVVRLTDPPAGAGEHRRDAMTEEEVERVLATSAAGIPTYREGTNEPDGGTRPDRLYALAELVLALGLRKGEALALRWQNVDLDAATVDVVDAKTPAGVRLVPIPAYVVEVLREHRAQQRHERMAADVWGDPDLVFASTVGTVIDGRNALRWWHDLTERAGVGRRRFHASRHTAATVMLNRGVPLELVSAILGHARLSITADVYARPNVELLRTASHAMEGAYKVPRSS